MKKSLKSVLILVSLFFLNFAAVSVPFFYLEAEKTEPVWENVPENFRRCYRAVPKKVEVREMPALAGKILAKLNENEEIFVDELKSSEYWLFCYVPRLSLTGFCTAGCFVIKPFFEEIAEKLCTHRAEYTYMVENGEVLPCRSITRLIFEQLQDYSFEDCLFVVQLALENGGKLISDGDFSTPLVESCRLNNFLLSEYLLDCFASANVKKMINMRNQMFAPPLYYAFKNGNVELADLLIRHGADAWKKCADFSTCLEHLENFMAEKQVSKETGRKLLELVLAGQKTGKK